jgi:hypothetical protein
VSRVKLGDGLFISILRKRAAHLLKLEFKTKEFQKAKTLFSDSASAAFFGHPKSMIFPKLFYFASSLHCYHFFSPIDIAMGGSLTLPLCNDLGRQTQGNSFPSIMNTVFSPRPTLTTFIIPLLFLGRINRMATHIGFLAPGLDGPVVTSGIGCKKLRKT